MSDSERIRIKVEQWPFVKLPSELLVCRGIQDAAKLTYLALRFWSREHGSTFTAHSSVREVVGVGRSTFYRHLRELEDTGWIRRESRADGLTDIHVLNARVGPIRETDHVPLEGPPPSHARDTPRPSGGTHTEKLLTEKLSTESTHPRGCLFDNEDENPKPSNPKSGPLTSLEADLFEAWWSRYPKKVGKGAAKKAWRKALAHFDSLDAMLEATRAWAHAHRHTERKYIPNPATWLNGERWEDDLEAVEASREPDEVDPTEELLRSAERTRQRYGS